MTEKITGIVLNTRKYNDRNLIITLFTKERGKLSFISPSGTGKASNARRAKLQPLSVISTEFHFKASVELQHMGSLTSVEIWSDLYFHPVKRALTLFVSEFLYRLLNLSMPDTALFDFIVDSLKFLDRSIKGVNDFHLVFLVSMLTLSGIQPDISGFEKGKVFDFASGSFTWEGDSLGPVLRDEEAEAVTWVSRLNFNNIKRLRLSSINRRRILYALLNYYSYHFPGLNSLKSPEVLREIFE